jgi:hypothetical protein
MSIFKKLSAGHWWLTPVILATQEQISGGWQLEANPGKIVCETLSRKKPITKKVWWSDSR